MKYKYRIVKKDDCTFIIEFKVKGFFGLFGWQQMTTLTNLQQAVDTCYWHLEKDKQTYGRKHIKKEIFYISEPLE